MTAAELRIGNLVIDDGAIESIDLSFFINYEMGYYNDKNLKPITLTEEWLVKFGFEWNKETECYHYFNFILNKLFVMMDIDIHVYVEYVHQLQNLYFALTGHELKLNQ